ncbi:6952_t:CDS:1, partial [Cetraspora pellucida]
CSNEKRQSQAKNLIETYMSVIIYQNKNSLIKKQIIPSQVTAPVFNYLDFLQNLDLLELSATIHDGMNPKQLSENSKKHQFPSISQWCQFIRVPSVDIHSDHLNNKNNKKKVDFYAVLQFLSTSKHSSSNSTNSSNSSTNSSTSSTRVNKSTEMSADRIAHIFCKIFSKRCPKLHQLSVDLVSRRCNLDEFTCNSLNSRLSGFSTKFFRPKLNHISQLTHLICTTKISKRDLFTTLAKVAHNISKLDVCIDYLDHNQYFCERIIDVSYVELEALSLSTLIKSQKRLTHLSLHTFPAGLQAICSAIHLHSNSLRSLSFVGVFFYGWEILPILAPLRKLEKLHCDSCHFQLVFELTPEPHPPVHLKFPVISILDMSNSYVEPQIMKYILNASSRKLQYLDLGRKIQDPKSPDDSTIMFGSVANKFTELKCLKTSFHETEISQLLSVFENCKKLETFILCQLESLNSHGMNELLKNLTNFRLSNLKHFGIIGSNYIFSPSNLQTFLSSLNEDGGINLKTLEISTSNCFNNEHLKVIIEYAVDVKSLNKLDLKVYRELNKDLVKQACEKVKDVKYELWNVEEQKWQNKL